MPIEKNSLLKLGSQSAKEVVSMPYVPDHYLYEKQELFKRLICRWLSFVGWHVCITVPDDKCFAQVFCSLSVITFVHRKAKQDQKSCRVYQILRTVAVNFRNCNKITSVRQLIAILICWAALCTLHEVFWRNESLQLQMVAGYAYRYFAAYFRLYNFSVKNEAFYTLQRPCVVVLFSIDKNERFKNLPVFYFFDVLQLQQIEVFNTNTLRM